jgi:hypothetical protein
MESKYSLNVKFTVFISDFKSPLHLCPEVQCSTDCKYGYEHDIQGCSTCKCKPLRKYYLIFIDVEYSMQTFTYVILIRVMVFSATFNNISVIL